MWGLTLSAGTETSILLSEDVPDDVFEDTEGAEEAEEEEEEEGDGDEDDDEVEADDEEVSDLVFLLSVFFFEDFLDSLFASPAPSPPLLTLANTSPTFTVSPTLFSVQVRLQGRNDERSFELAIMYSEILPPRAIAEKKKEDKVKFGRQHELIFNLLKL